MYSFVLLWKSLSFKVTIIYHFRADLGLSLLVAHRTVVPETPRIRISLCIRAHLATFTQQGSFLHDNRNKGQQTWGNNIKFVLPNWSKDMFKHSFLSIALKGWNALPQSAVEDKSLELFKASLPSVTY